MTSPGGANLGSAHGKVTINASPALRELARLRAANANTIGSLNQMGRAAIIAGTSIAAAGGLIAAGLVKAVTVSAQLQFKMSFLQATLNATDGEMTALGETVRDFGATSGFGPREVADAFVELGKAGVTAHEIIGGVGKAVITLGQSADIGLAQAASIIVSTQATFQLLGSEAQRTADIIQGAANASLIDVADFGTTMKYVGNVAATQGIQLEDLATAIAEVGNQGIRGSTAGTSLRRMLLQLTPRTDKAAEAMKELGIITKNGTNLFYDQEGSAKSLRDIFEILHQKTENLTDAKKKDALATIFGDRAIATALATAKGGAKAYDEFNKQLNESTAAEIAVKRFDNLEGAVRKFRGALETAFIAQGNEAQGVLQGMVENATALLKIFSQLSPETQKNISKVALYSAGILLLVGSMTILAGTVLRAVAVVKQLTLAIEASTIAMGASATVASLLATGMVGGLLIAIGAVVANLAGMASGAAEAARKIQDLTGAIDYSDTSQIYKARAEIKKLIDAEIEAQENTSLVGEAIGTLSGSVAASKTRLRAYSDEYNNLNKKLGDSYYNLKRIADVTGLSVNELKGLARSGHIDPSGDIKEVGQRILEYRAATVGGRVTTQNFTKAMDVMADSADEATGEVDDLETSLRKVADLNINAADAELAFRGAVNDAKDALKDSGRVFKSNGALLHAQSDEGQAAERALLGIASAGRKSYDALLEQGASEKDLRASQQKTRDQLIKTAMQMGMSRTAAIKYADKLGIIPPVKETQIKQPGMKPAQDAVDKYIKSLDKIKPEYQTVLSVLVKPGKSDPSIPKTGGDLILGPLGPVNPPAKKPGTPAPEEPPPPVKNQPKPSAPQPGLTPSSTTTIPTGVQPAMPNPTYNPAPSPAPSRSVRTSATASGGSTTIYELNGDIVANDPAQLQKDIDNKKRLAALRGG